MKGEYKVPLTENKIVKKRIIGKVISDKMDKTISVKSERIVKHPKYGKFIKKYTVFKAHDEKNEAKIDNNVEIISIRPISKTKRWELNNILN